MGCNPITRDMKQFCRRYGNPLFLDKVTFVWDNHGQW